MSKEVPPQVPEPQQSHQKPLAAAVQQAIPFQQSLLPPGVVVHQQTWTGPLPSPEQLKQFDTVLPGSAERILRMAEQEGEHSRTLQTTALTETTSAQRRGQYFAALTVVCGVSSSVLLALMGHDAVAAILAGTTLTTIVLAFLQSRDAEKKSS